MAKFVFKKSVPRETIKDAIEKALGPGFSVTLDKNGIKIIQSASQGCFVRVKMTYGTTICSGPYSFMSSGLLRIALLLGVVGVMFVIGLMFGYIVFGPGIVGVLIYFFFMKMICQEVVDRVAEILSDLQKDLTKDIDEQKTIPEKTDITSPDKADVTSPEIAGISSPDKADITPPEKADIPSPERPYIPIKTTNCWNCSTKGVLPMEGNICPNCKQPLETS
jgi:hypothetical protein